MRLPPAPFGTVPGLAPGGVEAYSCDYATADEHAYSDRRAFSSYLDGGRRAANGYVMCKIMTLRKKPEVDSSLPRAR